MTNNDNNIQETYNLDDKLLDALDEMKDEQETAVCLPDDDRTYDRLTDILALAAAADGSRRNDDVERRLQKMLAEHADRKEDTATQPDETQQTADSNTGGGWQKTWMTRMAVAAAACAALLLTMTLWKDKETAVTPARPQPVLFSIAQPKTDVTVKSEDGKRIEASVTDDGELLVNSLPETAERIEVAVPQGERLTVALPDGSKVFLHVGSSLKFPVRFVGNQRLVELKGQAYFVVAKDAEKPFVVKTERMTTCVLGTEFNITAEGTEADNVVLVSGSVSVSASAQRILKPGERARIDASGRFEVDEVDVTPYTSWRDGFVYFDDMTLKDVLLCIGHEYNYDVEFANSGLLDKKVHFAADRSEGVQGIIDMLNMMNIVRVELHGNKICVE